MAKKNFLGTVAKLGMIAAATAVVYSQREEIRGLIDEVAGRFFTDGEKPEEPFDAEPAEADIVIDVTEKEAEASAEETTEG